MVKSQKNTFFPTVGSYMRHLFKANKAVLVVYFACCIIKGAGDAFFPFLFGYMIGVFEKTPKEMLWDKALPVMGVFFGFMVFGGVFGQFLNYIRRMYTYPRLTEQGLMDSFTHTQKHSYAFFTNHFAGSLSNKIGDLSTGPRDIVWLLSEMLVMSSSFILSLAFFFTVNKTVALIVSVWMVFHITYTLLRMKVWNRMSFDAHQSRSKAMGKIVDTLTNYVNVKLFARRSFEEKYTKSAVKEFIKDRKKANRILQRDYNILVFCSTMVDIAVLALIVWEFLKGTSAVSDIVYITMGLRTVMEAVYTMGHYLADLADSYGQTRQALDIINKPLEMQDEKDAKELNVKRGGIRFEEVSFAYPNTTRMVLKKLALDIKPKEKIGVVGYSGAGKSTFIHLLLRYFDPTEGRIKIDGQIVSKVKQDSLHEHIAVIPQDTSLFHRSIMENLRYGKLEASDTAIIDAAKQAHAHEFIMNLPDKYESLVGERGVKLSVGQRQRIAIARAILKDAPILILDEATSALDSETEILIQDSLKELMKNKTSIVVAHRLSTLREMDRILVFDKGKITEEGSHASLTRKEGGLYARLWSMQSDGFLPTAFENINKTDD